MSDDSGPTGLFIDVEAWRALRETITSPWPIRLAEIDVAFLELELGEIPPRRKLMSRWGITERKARTVINRFKAKRPNDVALASQNAPVQETQAIGITTVDTTTPSQVNVVSVPKPVDRFREDIRFVFEAWEAAQLRRTRRPNKLTKGRERVLRAALKGGHTADDLILVVRMAFEFPDGDFLVDGWRKQGYMDIANLLNREKVDRNVTLANERWNGTEWVFSSNRKATFDPSHEALWEHLLFLVGAYPHQPGSLHKNHAVHAAMLEGIAAAGGWQFLGSLRPGRQQHVAREQFLSEVRDALQNQTNQAVSNR